jgi:hypothetical protein
MADASGSRLSIGAPVEKRGCGRPRGSKNKATATAAVASLSAPVKRQPGRPARSKNKLKFSSAALVQALLLVMLLLLRPEYTSSSTSSARNAVRFSGYRWNSRSLWTGRNYGRPFFVNTLGEEGSQNPDPNPEILRFYDPTTSYRSKSHYESQSDRIHVVSRSKS